MIQFLYNLSLVALAPLALPYWVVRSWAKGHPWRSLPEALGRLRFPVDTTAPSPIWFHAVSVGEVLASLPFLRQLHRELPSVPIYLSTGTPSGRQLAEARLGGIVQGFFRAPVELPWCVASVFSRLRPRALIIAETELWPNYFFQAKRFGAAALVVNGRLSDRSAPRYRALRFLFGPVLQCADLVLAQSPADRDRFIAAGCPTIKARSAGNFKYDADSASPEGDPPTDLERFLECANPDPLIVAGSTREGEEAMLAPALRAIAAKRNRLLVIDAPRHPHRFDEAERALATTGLPVLRRSRLDPSHPCSLPAILLLDSLGELASLYPRADLVFVGGSLNGWGGHNILEPVLHGRPVVVGPHMQNFRQITRDLLQAGGLLQVANDDELSRALQDLIANSARREALGRAGQAWALSQSGASERASQEAVRLYRRARPRQAASGVARVTLRPLATCWSAASRVRRWAYERGILARHRLAAPVISIGNLTVGGTGKTPMVAWLVERLAQAGHTAAVLTRGYGRDNSHRTHLAPAASGADPRLLGDEPAMLARRFASSAPSALLAVGADRYAAGRMAEGHGDIDFLVLDDGLQHLKLERSLEIVLLDGSQPFGNGYMLPLGSLREPPSSLAKADIVLVTRTEPEFDYQRLRAEVRNWNPRAPVFHARTVPRRLVDLRSGEACELAALASKRVAAFCGIGNPRAFWKQVRKAAREIVARRAFRDHHRYTPPELDQLNRLAAAQGAQAFVTTEKDAMNLPAAERLLLPTFVLEIDLEIDDAEELLARVKALRPDAIPTPGR